MLLWTRPQLVMIELTNLCNLRCIMCGIWEETPKKVFDHDLYERVLRQRAIRNARVLALTGGEPFLIKEFAAYYALARRLSPRSHVNVSTNGFYTERTLDFLAAADRRRTSITISYDGIRSHDAIRRVAGSQENLLETARQIRRRFPEVGLSLKLTITNDNHDEILDTARQCRDLGVPLRVKTLEKLVCHQGRYPSPVTGPEYTDAILASIDDQLRGLLRLRIETNRDYVERLLRKDAQGSAPCSCSARTLFVGIDGAVFLCRAKEPIGNVLHDELDAIWASSEKGARLRQMAECRGAPLGLGFTHA